MRSAKALCGWCAFFLITALGIYPAATVASDAAPGTTQRAADFLDQKWHLNPDVSFLTIQSVKKNAILETHRFANMSGLIDRAGKAAVKIDLASIETGVDIRNVRMRFLLFETFKFPLAEISAEIPPADMRRLVTRKRLVYPLKFSLAMHGKTKDYETEVVISRTYDNAVSVATTEPVIVQAADFGLTGGVAKLAEAVGGIAITPAAFVTFNLLFEGERFNPDVQKVVAVAARQAEETRTDDIAEDDCRSRFDVISNTRAIYFKTASAQLDKRSAPILASVATTLKRCPKLIVEAGGHTDADGSSRYNLRLSKARAQSVVDYLVAQGVTDTQMRAAGYGDTRPVVPNTTRANKARNRRIEFRVVGTAQ